MTENIKQETSSTPTPTAPEPHKGTKQMRGRTLIMHNALRQVVALQGRAAALRSEILATIVELGAHTHMVHVLAEEALKAADEDPGT